MNSIQTLAFYVSAANGPERIPIQTPAGELFLRCVGIRDVSAEAALDDAMEKCRKDEVFLNTAEVEEIKSSAA